MTRSYSQLIRQNKTKPMKKETNDAAIELAPIPFNVPGSGSNEISDEGVMTGRERMGARVGFSTRAATGVSPFSVGAVGTTSATVVAGGVLVDSTRVLVGVRVAAARASVGRKVAVGGSGVGWN